MNDRQRNRTLFECIRDRFEKTALLLSCNEKIKNVVCLCYLLNGDKLFFRYEPLCMSLYGAVADYSWSG
jgi:hypothetical protein